jgi:hypothetical protein
MVCAGTCLFGEACVGDGRSGSTGRRGHGMMAVQVHKYAGLCCVGAGRKGCDVWWLCVVVMTVERVLQVRLKFA